MFQINKNKVHLCVYLFLCFFIIQSSFSQPPPPAPPGNDVVDVELPIDTWQEVLIIPALLTGMFFIYKRSAPREPKNKL
jgi:hypothetical protein